MSGRRPQDSFLTYGQKWLAMESLPENKNMKGVLDRSFVHRFLVADVEYNIKDIIRDGGDPQYKPLHDGLIHLKKLLFAFRILHYDEPILDVKLNIKNRNAELVKSLIRLFQNSPYALARILPALSSFVSNRNAMKKNSLDARLRDVVTKLIDDRKSRLETNKLSDDDKELEPNEFSNQSIFDMARELLDGSDMVAKPFSFYTVEHGAVSYREIVQVLKSKFKAEPGKFGSGSDTKRSLKFDNNVLERLKINYEYTDEIRIIDKGEGFWPLQKDKENLVFKDATHATDATLPKDTSDQHETLSNGISNKDDEIISSKASKLHDNYTRIQNNGTPLFGNAGEVPKKNTSGSVASVASVAMAIHDSNSVAMAIHDSNCKASDPILRKLPSIPCLWCKYTDKIKFDLSLHYIEFHRRKLIELPIGRISREKSRLCC